MPPRAQCGQASPTIESGGGSRMAVTVWKGHLTFGLVSIPIRLFRAARKERISFHQLHRAEAPRPAPSASSPEAEPEPESVEEAEEPKSMTRVHQSAFAAEDLRPIPR